MVVLSSFVTVAVKVPSINSPVVCVNVMDPLLAKSKSKARGTEVNDT